MSERSGAPTARDRGSGPVVARAFHIGLSLVFLVAWLSLGAQVQVLIGSRGLLPLAPLVDSLDARGITAFSDFPTWLRYAPGDGAITFGIAVGSALSLLSLSGVAARAAFALNTFLYLGYAVACRNFLAFQWDNLLLELGALAVFLPAHERARWIHFCFRVALFKLYFESGIAKWQSHLGDWHDGSAMTYYYETAPLPAALGWLAHQLPAAWHHLESWSTLAFEIGAPVLAFGPRPGLLFCAAVLTLFQVGNLLTANYGFFSTLALVLHLFLLDDRDLLALGARLRRARAHGRKGRPGLRQTLARVRLARRGLRRARSRLVWVPRSDEGRTMKRLGTLTLATVVGGLYVGVSLFDGIHRFWPEGPQLGFFEQLRPLHRPYRLINNYHLFGHITRERIEPTFQTFDGEAWTTHDLHYKPGDPGRAPPYVAPHQPRVDFLLWFYGLGHARGTPLYVATLLDRLCHDPGAVTSLFVHPLPDAPEATRVAFYRYHFTTFEERARTGAWWTRTEASPPRTQRCQR
jgi:lipase maturation factor 1